MRPLHQVLIAEDDQLLAHAIGRVFEPPSFQIENCPGDDRVFEVLAHRKTDAVLIGCPRPTREVLDRLEKIRREWPRCAMVVMTSGTRPRISKDFAETLKFVILEKPFDSDGLKTSLVRAFALLGVTTESPASGEQHYEEKLEGEVAPEEAFDQVFVSLVQRQPLDPSLDAFDVVEAHLIRRALIHCNGNQSRAARFLGITRNTLRKRIAKYKFESLVSNAAESEGV